MAPLAATWVGCKFEHLYLGSFSMMSASALSGVLRGIIASAGGYAIQMAIEAICPPCANYVSKFQTLMSQLNSGSMNTCQLGRTVAAGAASKLFDYGRATDEYEKQSAVIAGKVNDIYEAAVATFGSPNANRSAAENKTTAYGNSLMNSLSTTGALNVLDDSLLGGKTNAMELMMNLFGFSVTPTTDQGGSGSKPQDDKVYPALLTYNDLKNGRSGDVGAQKINSCASSILSFGAKECQNITTKDFTFTGVKRGIIRQLAGDQPGDGLTIYEVQSGSILSITGSQNKDGNVTLNDVQKNLMAISPSNLRPLWAIAGSKTTTGNEAANMIADILADVVAAKQLEALVRTMRLAHRPGSVDGKQVAPMSDEQLQAIQSRIEEAKAAGATGSAMEARISNLLTAYTLANPKS